MRIDALELRGFRNYQAEQAAFHPERNVVTGENAQGKTNLLEALSYLSRGRSPRTRRDRDLIGFSADAAELKAAVFSRDRDFLLEAALFRDRRRQIRVNRVAGNGAALSGVLNTVYFCPEDLYLIRAGAAERRRFLDAALCQLLPRYAKAHAACRRAIEQKARILRDREQYPGLLDTLPEFNEQIARYGAAVIRCRARFVLRLQEYAQRFHRDCSGGREELTVEYRTVSTVTDPAGSETDIAEAVRAHTASHAAAELASGLCLSGPHKDDFDVNINGREAKTWSSQGQTRTAALSLKLAEREIFRDAAGEYPVLLLDDVLSELDPRRQEYVLSRLSAGQVFITCCEDDRLDTLGAGKILRIREGHIETE